MEKEKRWLHRAGALIDGLAFAADTTLLLVFAILEVLRESAIQEDSKTAAILFGIMVGLSSLYFFGSISHVAKAKYNHLMLAPDAQKCPTQGDAYECILRQGAEYAEKRIQMTTQQAHAITRLLVYLILAVIFIDFFRTYGGTDWDAAHLTTVQQESRREEWKNGWTFALAGYVLLAPYTWHTMAMLVHVGQALTPKFGGGDSNPMNAPHYVYDAIGNLMPRGRRPADLQMQGPNGYHAGTPVV